MTILNSILSLTFLLFSSLSFAQSLKEKLFKETSSGHVSYSYSAAREQMFNHIYLEKDHNGYYIKGVYCLDKHYPFGGAHPNNRLPDHNVFNTEHTWPQSKFSPHFDKDVQKTDLHHLFPTFSRINSQRGNLPFAEVSDDHDLFCDESEIGSPSGRGEGNYFEPPDVHKGNVARALFYFSIRYKSSIDPIQEEYLRLWHAEDPVDANERLRHEKVSKLQKNRNPFIDHPELVDRITNF